eukprot:TRINITY_DN2808_c0_g1_i1.p1 TRINITY_DN2808_c0_g1~~TRINITY_DN2808_c0_g1_i1.p1  ORF type:complete len:399 (-),score=69.21 TRINITY_DN2808_c0_g1_i1:60-1199(-)
MCIRDSRLPMKQVDWSAADRDAASSRGKVHKGFVNTALGKSQIGSIPSKLEIIILPKNNRRAFGTSADRFGLYDSLAHDVVPGPGRYSGQSSIAAPEYVEKAHSTKGFVPQSRRFVDSLSYVSANNGPGPGSYNLPTMAERIHKQSIKKNRPSFMFITTKPATVGAVHKELPGPGAYDIDQKIQYIRKDDFISPVFRSTSKRDPYADVVHGPVPAPGTYEIDRSLSPQRPFQEPNQSAAFVTATTKKREGKDERIKKLIKEEEGQQLSPRESPLDVSDLRSRPDVKENAIFKQGIKDRFGQYLDNDFEAKKFHVPGPGQYELPLAMGKAKSLVSGSAFMSETKRDPYGLAKEKKGSAPGVSHLNPLKPAKKQSLSLIHI